MKSPSEIAREIAEYQLARDCSCELPNKVCWVCKMIEHIAEAITTERQRQERLIELVDGCTPVIESWAVISVAQAEWKKRWLSEAQQVLKEVKGA